MKFTVERDHFLVAVKRASGVIAGRNAIPALACVHIAATDTGLRVRGTNLDEWVTVACDAAVAVPGSACINAAQLSAWLAASPKGALVDFKLGERADLTAGRSTASFAYLDSADFPTPPNRDADIEVHRGIEGLRVCAPYASDEETLYYYLKGVAINSGHAVATNGHILAALNIDAPIDLAAIIPTFGVRQIIQSSDAARLFIGEYTWACEDGPVVMGGKLIEGTFPEWSRVAPKDLPVVATIDADAMADAVAQVQVASGDRVKGIAFEGNGETVSVSCRGDAMAASATVAGEGEAFSAGISSRYAQIAMKTFAGRVISLATDEGCPVVMTSDAAPGLIGCIMQMRV